MSFEFTTIGEFATIQGGYAFKSHDFIADSEFPVLKIKNIRNGFVDYGDTSFISAKIANGANKWLTNEGDILVSMTGSGPNAPDSLVGRIARVWRGDRPAFINQRVGRVVLKEANRIDPDFIYYVLSQKETQEFLVLNSTGSANQVNINSKTIESVPCPNIDYETSKSIAKVLRSLDKRIRLLGETNTTLESIAQALFKSWFVDFDPVHANAGTQTPSLPPEIQSLFPSTFVESPLGLVPEGWGVGTLSDCCKKVESGGTPKRNTPEYWNGDVPWLSSGEVRQPIVFDSKEKISQLGVSESSAKLWPSGTTVVAMYGATAGEVCLLANPSTANQACCGLIPKEYSRSFLFFCVRRERENLASKSSGSAQQNLNKGIVAGHEVLHPSDHIFQEFESATAHLLDGWIANEKKMQTLSSLRDTLLPRLISGQLRLPEVE